MGLDTTQAGTDTPPRKSAAGDRSSLTVVIDNAVTGEVATSFTVQVIINQPSEGTYRVVVVGLGRPSELAVHAFSTDGSAEPRIAVTLRLEKEPRTEYRLHFLKAPGSSSQLEKIEPGGPP